MTGGEALYPVVHARPIDIDAAFGQERRDIRQPEAEIPAHGEGYDVVGEAIADRVHAQVTPYPDRHPAPSHPLVRASMGLTTKTIAPISSSATRSENVLRKELAPGW